MPLYRALTASRISGLAASATIDTTNAANISSNTLAVARGGNRIGAFGHGDATVTLTTADLPVIVTTATLTAPRTWTLPLLSSMQSGEFVTVCDEGNINGANTLTIQRQSSDLMVGTGVAGNAAITIGTAGGSVTFRAANVWLLIAKT
jgi:hypothetical protein